MLAFKSFFYLQAIRFACLFISILKGSFQNLHQQPVYILDIMVGVCFPLEFLVVRMLFNLSVPVAPVILCQAEHGGDSVVGFVTNSSRLLKQVEKEVARQLKRLSRSEYIGESLRKAGFAVLVRSIDDAIKICNEFAPEHLSLVVKDSQGPGRFVEF